MVEENKLVALIDKDNIVYNVLETERHMFSDREATPEEIEKKNQNERKEQQIEMLKQKLREYSDDIVQDLAGEVVPNIEERKTEFMRTHDMLRLLLNKPVRAKKSEDN